MKVFVIFAKNYSDMVVTILFWFVVIFDDMVLISAPMLIFNVQMLLQNNKKYDR